MLSEASSLSIKSSVTKQDSRLLNALMAASLILAPYPAGGYCRYPQVLDVLPHHHLLCNFKTSIALTELIFHLSTTFSKYILYKAAAIYKSTYLSYSV